jgi:hypothetical protein
MAHPSTVVTPPAPAAKNLGVGLGGPARGRISAEEELIGRCIAKHSKYCRTYLYSGKVTLLAI